MSKSIEWFSIKLKWETNTLLPDKVLPVMSSRLMKTSKPSGVPGRSHLFIGVFKFANCSQKIYELYIFTFKLRSFQAEQKRKFPLIFVIFLVDLFRFCFHFRSAWTSPRGKMLGIHQVQKFALIVNLIIYNILSGNHSHVPFSDLYYVFFALSALGH